MKNYYQKKGPYTLRENTYRRMRYLIADYDFFKAAQRGEIEFYQSKDERNSATETSAIKRVNFDLYVQAIENAIQAIPSEYVRPVQEHLIYRKPYAYFDYVSESTLKKWVQRYIWHVAKELGEI